MKPPSQCERVHAVLRDHAWHSIEEIHQRAGTMRLNSRISDLRERGLSIEHSIRHGHHGYRLVPLGEPDSRQVAEPGPPKPGSPSGSDARSPHPAEPLQLPLELPRGAYEAEAA